MNFFENLFKPNPNDKRPEMPLRQAAKILAYSCGMTALTLGIILIVGHYECFAHPSLPAKIALVAVLTVLFVIWFRGLLKILRFRIQKEDELALQLHQRAGNISVLLMLFIGFLIGMVMKCLDASFNASGEEIIEIVFISFMLRQCITSLVFLKLDSENVDTEEEEDA